MEWSTASLPTTSALSDKNQNGASSYLLNFLPVSLVVIQFSLISSQQHIPPSSLCLPFLQEISLTTVLFFHFMTWLLGLYYCVRVFLVLVVTLPPSFSLRPYINTGSDFSLLVYNMFLQLYQERCVNGREACWVAGLVF